MRKGFLITLEGPEGGGKSTQAALLVKRLRRAGRAVVQTREPGGTRLAERVRGLLLDPKLSVSALAELFLYEAARAQHVADVIRPALEKGRVVVCDRFTDSTTVYQGWGRGLPRKAIAALNRIAAGGLAPHVTFLLDSPARDGLARARRKAHRGRGDRMEREPLRFHERIRRGFLTLARREPSRFRILPWSLGIEKRAALIAAEVERRLQRKTE